MFTPVPTLSHIIFISNHRIVVKLENLKSQNCTLPRLKSQNCSKLENPPPVIDGCPSIPGFSSPTSLHNFWLWHVVPDSRVTTGSTAVHLHPALLELPRSKSSQEELMLVLVRKSFLVELTGILHTQQVYGSLY